MGVMVIMCLCTMWAKLNSNMINSISATYDLFKVLVSVFDICDISTVDTRCLCLPLLQGDELHSMVLLSLCSCQAESSGHSVSWQTLLRSSGTLIWHPGWLMHENDKIRFTYNGMTDSILHRTMAGCEKSIH